MAGVWEDDFMERKPSADFLTSYILNNPHVKVLNVNSPWGTGKSFFLERWAKMLSEKHVCVRFNAWETDYSAEPLVALIACIEEQLTDPSELSSTKVGAAIIDTGSVLVKKAGPLILKGLVRKFSGVELDELLGKGAEDSVDGVVEALIKDQAETRHNVKEFKEEVANRLSRAALDKGLKAPAFIFIDELDRCRPTYAIELLERIKHFFELEDCRFVIASDSAQLAHSIRAVYGQGFASERYLNRFFDAEFRLDNEDIFALVKNILPKIESLLLGINVSGDLRLLFPAARARGEELKEHNRDTVICGIPGYAENHIIIVALARCFDVGLRELTNYVRQIKSAADTIGDNVNFFWLAFLVFYKNSKLEQYQDFFSAKGPEELKGLLGSRLINVNFHFNTSLESVLTLAGFYHTLVIADQETYSRLGQNLYKWRSAIYHDNYDADRREHLRNYRKIVDLAYRLN
ncbi:KAP family P-loop NTPase fold protein [Pseudomonas inefficax]|uniref:KAP family P-loop NTPase fold protein n=1 Tax=Pseudomonas inefficax TaxID=2078786 RepID=UPI0035C56F4F